MSEQSKNIRCAKWETCQQQCASGAKSPFPAYNRIYAPLCFVEQPTYPACLECGHSDRPVCCIPVEQPAPEPPALLDLEEITERNLDRSEWGTAKRDVSNLVAEILNLCAEGNVLKAALAETHDDLDLCQGEVERLRKEQSADGAERGLMLLALMAELEQVCQQRDELYVKLAKLTGLAVARWLAEIADTPLPDHQYRCSVAEVCTEMDCPLMKAHEPGTHANCGMLHFCGWVFEDVRCVEVTK